MKDYELLRDWYLAYLRKGALENAERLEMTPAALIKADRQNLMQLVQQVSSPATGVGSDDGPILKVWMVFLVWALSLSGFFTGAAIASGGDGVKTLEIFTAALLGPLNSNAQSVAVPVLLRTLPLFALGIPFLFLLTKQSKKEKRV